MPDRASMPESPDVNTLKRRGRRRLVGAVALVLLAVIVLPMVFDPEPRVDNPPVAIRIPSESATPFSPPLGTTAPPVADKPSAPIVSDERRAAADPGKTAAGTPGPAALPDPNGAKAGTSGEPPAATAPAKARTADEERARAESALRGTEYVVPLIALANTDKVKQLTVQLSAAKLPHYTEPVPTAEGTVTRVRVGPFVSRRAADHAFETLRRMGFKPGKVVER